MPRRLLATPSQGCGPTAPAAPRSAAADPPPRLVAAEEPLLAAPPWSSRCGPTLPWSRPPRQLKPPTLPRGASPGRHRPKSREDEGGGTRAGRPRFGEDPRRGRSSPRRLLPVAGSPAGAPRRRRPGHGGARPRPVARRSGPASPGRSRAAADPRVVRGRAPPIATVGAGQRRRGALRVRALPDAFHRREPSGRWAARWARIWL